MRLAFKITNELLNRVYRDLERPHPFAAERVGFLSCRMAGLKPSGWVVLAREFHPVQDDDYLQDFSVGAMMGPAAIRKALQVALASELGMFHVHIHGHRGVPTFSRVDLRETAKFVPDFWHVQPNFIHGALAISLDSMAGLCWHPYRDAPIPISDFSIVGAPMRFIKRRDEREI